MGRIGRAHGVKGETTVVPETDHPDRFVTGAVFTTDAGRELTVVAVAPYRDRGLLVRFEGVASRGEADALRGALLTIPSSERRPLEASEWWQDDLVGLVAVDEEDRELGTVSRVEIGPTQDRLVVTTGDGADVLVPFVAEIVGDPEGGRIPIRDPGGLF